MFAAAVRIPGADTGAGDGEFSGLFSAQKSVKIDANDSDSTFAAFAVSI